MTTTDHQPVMTITEGASGIGFAPAQLWLTRGGKAVLLGFNEVVLQGSPRTAGRQRPRCDHQLSPGARRHHDR